MVSFSKLHRVSSQLADSGNTDNQQSRSYAQRIRRRMLLEQVAMAVLAISLFFTIA